MKNRSRFHASIAFLTFLILLTACVQSPQAGAQGDAIQPAVRILDLTGLSNTPTSPPIPTAFPTFTPRPTPSPAPTSTTGNADTTTIQPTNTPACTNQAEFVKHLAVSDNTHFHQGEVFTKVWLVKNTGSCTWDSSYALIFAGGDLMSGPQELPMPTIVPPGEFVELRVPLVAPMAFNSFFSNWMLRDASGNIFGIGVNQDDPLVINSNRTFCACYHTTLRKGLRSIAGGSCNRPSQSVSSG